MKLSKVSLHAFLLWLFLVSYVRGRFVVEKNSITVLFPRTLYSIHDASIGNFGLPSYGEIIVGSVVYPEKGSRGCQPFEGDKPFKFRSHRPTIVLLDRGDCYFTLKVWHAQLAGAAAVLVVDSIDEPLIIVDSSEESTDIPDDDYVKNIQIPSALITKTFGDTLKEALNKNDEVLLRIDLRQSPLPDKRVEYEFWTNIIDECGATCDEQMNFVKNFKGHAQILERGGYTLFTPHYITWYCPMSFVQSSECKSQCINNGRYCAPDLEKGFGKGYQGKDAVYENLRQLCVHRVAAEINRPWVWWDYVTDFHIRCSMKEGKYTRCCAEDVMKSLDLPIDTIKKCVGDPEADVENEVLRNEQQLQIGHGFRGDITMFPSLVINNVQYRGKLERTAILQAICSRFETKEPPVCLNEDIVTNECLERNGGCWQDQKANITACKDTFKGRVCECPHVKGVHYEGDGYTSCEGFGPATCSINNEGCWAENKDGLTYSACLESTINGCRCPDGFRGDGHNKCEDVDECKERIACQCDGCTCKNTWGTYDCKCKENLLYIKELDVCIDNRHIHIHAEMRHNIFLKLWNFLLSLFSCASDT